MEERRCGGRLVTPGYTHIQDTRRGPAGRPISYSRVNAEDLDTPRVSTYGPQL